MKTHPKPLNNHQAERILHWNKVAQKMHHWRGCGGYYHRRLNEIYSRMIPNGARVLEIGCGNGSLLASVKPEIGVGVDFSLEMVTLAAEQHPELHFVTASAEDFKVDEKI